MNREIFLEDLIQSATFNYYFTKYGKMFHMTGTNSNVYEYPKFFCQLTAEGKEVVFYVTFTEKGFTPNYAVYRCEGKVTLESGDNTSKAEAMIDMFYEFNKEN